MEVTGFALWLNTFFAAFDLNIALAVHKLYTAGGGFFTPFFEFISFLGKDGLMLILLGLILTFFPKTRKYGTALILSIAIGALLTNCCLKILIARPRPYADESSAYYQLWLTVGQNLESDKSFPSGHTTAAFAAMTAIFLAGNRKISWTAYIFGVLMGIARIYLVVHYTTDVIAGVIVGLLAGIAGYIISVRLPEVWYEIDFAEVIRELRHGLKKGAHEK